VISKVARMAVMAANATFCLGLWVHLSILVKGWPGQPGFLNIAEPEAVTDPRDGQESD